MDLQLLVYSPLLEEEQSFNGWSKQTIDYISKNKSKVAKIIQKIALSKSKRPLQSSDIEDIYSEVLMYLYKCDDYNINKAVERSSSGSIVTLEGYINSCIKYCVIRYMTTEYKKEKVTVRDGNGPDNNLCIFDTISDEKSLLEFDDATLDLEQQCKACEYLRYKYGPDIFLVWYVRLLTLSDGLDDAYKNILSVLGVSKKELQSVERKSYDDQTMVNFARAVNKYGIEKSLKTIEKYVYSANNIREAVSCYH